MGETRIYKIITTSICGKFGAGFILTNPKSWKFNMRYKTGQGKINWVLY